MMGASVTPAAKSHRRLGKQHHPMINMTTLVLWTVGGVVVLYAFGLILFLRAHLPLFQAGQTLRGSPSKDAGIIISSETSHRDRNTETEPIAKGTTTLVNDAPASNTALQPNQNPPPSTKPKKYIMFMPIQEGQGIGNIMNGLLAAHLFGDEFGRQVCVSTQFQGFHMAFEPLEDGVLEECSKLQQDGGQQLVADPIIGDAMFLYNYGQVPDECALKDLLSSSTELLFYCGNTYPRWPVVPEQYFAKFYRPRKVLLDMMPWTRPPETVVHLRAPDMVGDQREGLDDATLQVLGETLPHDTFLVTNRVVWYDMFEKTYGWSHPEWEEITHSAISLSWGARNVTSHRRAKITGLSPQAEKTLSMFCDWYTISQAKHVVHTHSDFSLSAIHFMNIHNSQTIMGSENGALTLVEESWRRDGETPRLVDRTGENLRLCGSLDAF